jgi:hypothetical protein
MIERDKERNPLVVQAAITIIGRDRAKRRDRYATTTEKERGTEKGKSRLQAGSTIPIHVKTSTQTSQTPIPESVYHPHKPAIAQAVRPTSDRKTLVPSCASWNKKKIRNV